MPGLRTTIYKVFDLNEATEWYAKAFNKAPYFIEPFYVGFDIGGYELGLMPEETDQTEKKLDNVVAYWGVSDMETSIIHMESLGAKVVEKPNNVGGNIIVASVKDPWGNVIGLIKNPNFKPNTSTPF